MAEIAEDAGAGTGEDDAPVALFVHVRPDGVGDVGRAGEMHLHDEVELVQRHVLERLIAQNAGVVHQNVDATEGAKRIGGNALGTVAVRHGRLVGDRIAAERLDFRHHFVRGIASAAAIHAAAKVIHDHFGTALGELDGVAAANASARAGHDGHLAGELTLHQFAHCSPRCSSSYFFVAAHETDRRIHHALPSGRRLVRLMQVGGLTSRATRRLSAPGRKHRHLGYAFRVLAAMAPTSEGAHTTSSSRAEKGDGGHPKAGFVQLLAHSNS